MCGIVRVAVFRLRGRVIVFTLTVSRERRWVMENGVCLFKRGGGLSPSLLGFAPFAKMAQKVPNVADLCF